jgi:hypothetical protein
MGTKYVFIEQDNGKIECFGTVVPKSDITNDLSIPMGKVSDGSHTFDELYFHRMVLFSIICNTYRNKAWKSWLHSDGTMFKDYFIVGITTESGDYSYHYHKDHWDRFDVKELEKAPEYDGHKPEDIERLYDLLHAPLVDLDENISAKQFGKRDMYYAIQCQMLAIDQDDTITDAEKYKALKQIMVNFNKMLCIEETVHGINLDYEMDKYILASSKGVANLWLEKVGEYQGETKRRNRE